TTDASVTEPTWPSGPPGEIYPSKADSTIVATRPRMTCTRLGPSFVECERNDARGEHGHGENLARYKEWFTKPPNVGLLANTSSSCARITISQLTRRTKACLGWGRMKVVLQCNLHTLLS